MKSRIAAIRPHVRYVASAVLLVSGLPWPAWAVDVLDVREVAALLRIDEADVVMLAESAGLPCRSTGSGLRCHRAAVMQWVAGGDPWTRPAPLAASETRSLRARGLAPAEESVLANPTAKAANQVANAVDAASASELFLRDNAVLLKPNQWSASLNLSALSSEHDEFIPELGVARQTYQSQFSAGVGFRYGVSEDFQLGLDIPLTKQNNVTVIGSDVTASNGGFRVGSGALSASYALLREESGWPGLTVNAVVAPFGKAKSFGAGVTLTRSYDPVVLYGSAAFSKPIGSRDEPAQNFSSATLSGGFVFAVNSQFSWSAGLSTVIGKGQVEPSNLSWTRSSLQLGVGTTIARGVYVEPRLSMTLNGPRTVAFGVDIVYQ